MPCVQMDKREDSSILSCSLQQYSVTISEVKELVKAGKYEELRVRMMTNLAFGTAGNF